VFAPVVEPDGNGYRKYNNEYLDDKLLYLLPGGMLFAVPHFVYPFGVLYYFLLCHNSFIG
jgi:hypothetical protein